MLLFDQVVYEEQVELAWQLWNQMSEDGTKEPLWRVLTLFPEVDRELVYAEAARVYGFETARISRGRAITLIHEVEKQVPAASWDQLVELRVIPITEAEQAHTHRQRLVYASQDPTRPEVHRLLPNLNLGGFELRYATEREIISLLIEAFPQRYNHLRSLSGVSKDFLAGGVQQERVPSPLPADTHTVLDLFSDVLAAAILLGATDLCLMPTPTDEVEVYVQLDDQLKRERVIADHTASDVLSIIKREVIGQEACEDGRIQKSIIERMVDGTTREFRVSAIPPSEEIPTECIVVRML
jgi:type IV pilus assembly protein PilB